MSGIDVRHATVRERTGKVVSSGGTLDPAPVLLGRLEGVITTGKGWRARCPSHGGRSASLAIAQAVNGSLLLHCFAGCSVADVLAAAGLQVSDLFVHRDLRSRTSVERQQLRQAALALQWRAAVSVLSEEASVLLMAANQLSEGIALDDADRLRVGLAALRVCDACEVLCHG